MRYRPLRWPCRYALTVEQGGRAHAATLANIAAPGALVVGLPAAHPGDRLVLRLPAGPRPAEVRWARADRCGVRFAAPLAPEELRLVRGLAGTGSPSHLAGGMQEME